MGGPGVDRRLFERFAELLDYPGPGLLEAVRECETLVAKAAPEAAALLCEFRAFVQAAPLGRVQEVYSGTFDLDAAYHPYVGYHLFGETYKRSVFMLELRARYRAQGFVVDRELPDHLAVLLRFVARYPDTSLAGEIIREALLPGLDRMTGKARSAGYDEEESPRPEKVRRGQHSYRGVLEALRLTLQRIPADAASGAAGVADHSTVGES